MTDQTQSRVRMQPAARREQILHAATTLISQRGYWGLSLQAVADACGITQPGLLHHFNSKDVLLVAVLDRRDQLDARALFERLGVAGRINTLEDLTTLGLDLAAVCAAAVQRNAAQREVVRFYTVLQAESLLPEHPAHAYFIERERRSIRILAGLAPIGTDGEVVARRVLALMDGLQIQWLRNPDMDLVGAWQGLFDQSGA